MDTPSTPQTRSCLLIDASRAIRGENVLELATAVERLRNEIEQDGHEVLSFSYANMPAHASDAERKYLRDEIELADLPAPIRALDIREALEETRLHIKAGDHIVICSTDPLEATSELRRYIEQMRTELSVEISGVMWSEQLSTNLLGGAANRLFGYERGVAAQSPADACARIAELLGFEEIAQRLDAGEQASFNVAEANLERDWQVREGMAKINAAPQLSSIEHSVDDVPAPQASGESPTYDLALTAIAALEKLAQLEGPGSNAHDVALEAAARMRATLPRPDADACLPSELEVRVEAYEEAEGLDMHF